MLRGGTILGAVALVAAALFHLPARSHGGAIMTLELTSSVFRDGGKIPRLYTCDGDDVSPPLFWGERPEGIRSLALIVDDPDAPGKTFVHWVLFNIPPERGKLPENVPSDPVLASGARQGKNDFGNLGYGGPCPPGGTHRYYFKLYALDTELDLEPGSTKEQVLEAMEGHVLAEGQLLGRYSR